jgi:hypothetical protein
LPGRTSGKRGKSERKMDFENLIFLLMVFSIFFEYRRLQQLKKTMQPSPNLSPLKNLETVDSFLQRKKRWATIYSTVVLVWLVLWCIVLFVTANYEMKILPSVFLNIAEFISTKKVFTFVLTLVGILCGRVMFRIK